MKTTLVEIVVLDYSCSTVTRLIDSFPVNAHGNVDLKIIEDYLYNRHNYRENEISYMVNNFGNIGYIGF